MPRRITLSMSRANIAKAKRIATKRNCSVSKLVSDYFEMLAVIDQRLATERPSSFVTKFARIVNTGGDKKKR